MLGLLSSSQLVKNFFVEPISNQICTDFAGLRLFKQSFTCAIKVKTKDQSRIVSAGKVLILEDDAFNQENYLMQSSIFFNQMFNFILLSVTLSQELGGKECV